MAQFQPQYYTIGTSANPANGGTITGGGTFQYGESCTVGAGPSDGYTFINWTSNGSIVSTEQFYTFTVTCSLDLVANFQIQTFTISLSANPTNAGSVSGAGTYSYGTSCTVTTTPYQRYLFANWTENGTVVSTDQSYTFTVTANRNLVANFEIPMVEITTEVNPEEAGIVIGAGTYHYGDEVTLTIVRHEDWAFQNWTENGEVVSVEMNYTFIATEDRVLIANFIFTEGIGENSIAANVYPNPTQGEITLEGEGLNHVRIVNAYGQTVYNAKVESEQVRIDLSNVAKGIYMMHIEAEGGQTVRKIVVE